MFKNHTFQSVVVWFFVALVGVSIHNLLSDAELSLASYFTGLLVAIFAALIERYVVDE